MKRFFLPALFVLFSHTCLATNNDFEPGYIIKAGKDSIRGYIEARSNYSMSDSINFKRSLNDQSAFFTTDSIAGFGFDTDNSLFQSVWYSDEGKDGSILVKKFAKVIMEGQASLYLLETSDYVENSQPDLYLVAVFISKKANQYYTLRQSQQGFEAPLQKKYLAQLPLLFADCPEISTREIKSISFSVKSMTSIFRKYNNCKNNSAVLVEYKTVSKWNLIHELSPGYIASSAKSPQGNGSGFSAAYNMNFVKKGSTMQHVYTIGLMYRSNSFMLDYSSIVLNIHASVQQTIISLPLTYRYYFTTIHKGPFIGGGFGFGYAIVSSDSKSAEEFLSNSFEIIPSINAGWNVTKKVGIAAFVDQKGFFKSYNTKRIFAGIGLSVRLN